MTDRDLDIVLFGATGFVGALTAKHLAGHAPTGLRIALAGRNRARLEQVRSGLGESARNWPLLVADATDAESLRALAERAQVVVTTVGPYAAHGLPLVEACARAGADYVDLTGEVLFVRKSIDLFDAIARDTGARIVHSCGFDSIPSDLAVFNAAGQAALDGAGELAETVLLATLKGGFSGGTIASAMLQADEVRSDRTARRAAADTFALSPDRADEPTGEHRDTLTVAYDQYRHTWVAPFVMASFNTRVVRRSNALLNHRYGQSFRYREVMRTGDGLKGRATAQAVRAALVGGFTAIAAPFARPVVNKVLPKAGEGPSPEKLDAGFFTMDVRAETTTGAVYRSVVSAQGDPGYKATAVMLGESALTLAVDRAALPKLPQGAAGGVLTPAVALGDALSSRLRSNGFTITVASES
ncbi:saccharopine dehydrogenase family protein [Leekyejoonella antrihumi]|uniref:Enoyl-ACP reductase n=1 Tax=Leekyejoonella antrihumi TaxID=1660198 RepID=A0A563DZ43_9MICO|nr:saccharopine dehydrogenase NADP-binding domain-containing protein [Leekyejoonella antrihumi]TWP35530.1 enoyl-ACP reductase [Leekyejoonella antrihumi]